ncbi:N-alpha-acetyltransferase 38-B, NatC auxiliary subunit [Colletotrichum tanaceti]|uniref:N-alpha-acetyltransferase 38-B, NatC auxiliary subunit n=1 Tax=Colletotrichum tanaceti TaxID=1306861 RepID=A0A4U6XRC0_9PEZI|nr:N-alpha-acetyltransferase 38-B, NatC auxiliary subunit [Colletotrichum tanaceti]TKW58425.1 N-alpha-acetyltransferase 38-B, NatC auxiliary subunit [Colletotrichum tanaceti]
MEKEAGRGFLTSILNKNLRILVTDGRMFLGQFKCTDPDRNVVLAHAYEYRQPSAQQRTEVSRQTTDESGTVTMDMTSRYLGLVVVPGQYIVKIEVEEFASQIRGQNPYADVVI